MLEAHPYFAEINLDAAIRLGDSLHQARLANAQKLEDIAKAITLSKKQIKGIELIEFSCFISSEYYILAAKKYAKYLKVDFDFSGLLDAETLPPPIYSNIPAERKNPSQQSKTDWLKNKLANKKFIASLLTFCLLLVFASKTIKYQPITVDEPDPIEQDVKSDQAPTKTQTEEQTSATEVKVNNTSIAINTKTEGDEIFLEINDKTWIQVIYRNDEKNQKTYTAGENLHLKREDLQGLVIGNAAAVKLITLNKQQDISPFVTSGSNVAKLFGEKLRSIGK